MTKRLTSLGSIGYEKSEYYDPQTGRNKHGKLFTMVVYMDGVRKELNFEQQSAQNIYNTIQSTWKKNF